LICLKDPQHPLNNQLYSEIHTLCAWIHYPFIYIKWINSQDLKGVILYYLGLNVAASFYSSE